MVRMHFNVDGYFYIFRSKGALAASEQVTTLLLFVSIAGAIPETDVGITT
jgi:hypothetical protein